MFCATSTRANRNTVDFAKLATARHLRPSGGSEKRTTYEGFEKGGYWLTRNRDDLGQKIEELLGDLCMFASADYRTPEPLNENSFFNGLTSSFLGRLAGPWLPDLDGECTRYRILLSEMWTPCAETTIFEDIKVFLQEHIETGNGRLRSGEEGRGLLRRAREARLQAADGAEALWLLGSGAVRPAHGD
ncbi:unnamed protein product [Symbiodinium sp. CCMP2592]|nr:unnamed protein product [Symbiodinium sp. CCMP2592]